MHTINAVPDMPAAWLTTAQTAQLLGKNERTIQEMGKDGRIRTKPAGRPDQPRQRLYDAADVERIIAGAPVRTEPRKPNPSRVSGVVLARLAKPSQGERALDTVSLVGQMMAGHKNEMQLLVEQSNRNLEAITAQFADSLRIVATLILDAHKAERDDARQRWELERQDRLARLERTRRARTLPPPAKAKAKRAHA